MKIWGRAKIRRFVLSAGIASSFAFLCAHAQAIENHGQLSVEDYYSKDSTSGYYQHFLTTRARMDITRLNKPGTIGFHFDGRQRNNLGTKGYKPSSNNGRIDTLNFDYTGKRLYLAIGRLWPKEFYMEHIDGINISAEKNGLGAGLFAGAKPEPYTEAFNTSYTAYGAYFFYQKKDLSANLAFSHNGYKGGTDRQYVYGQVSYSPADKFIFFGSVTADIKQKENKGLKLTNGIVELTYRPDFKKSLSVGYNQYRAFKLYRSMTFEFDDSRQQAYYISGSYRVRDRYTLYGRAERQTRYYPSIEKRFRNSNSYRAGVNIENILDTKINMDASVALTRNYDSRHKTYYIELSRLNWEVFQLVLSGSYLQNQYAYANTDNIWTLGASGYLALNRQWNLSFSYDREQGRYYANNRVMSRVSYRY